MTPPGVRCSAPLVARGDEHHATAPDVVDGAGSCCALSQPPERGKERGRGAPFKARIPRMTAAAIAPSAGPGLAGADVGDSAGSPAGGCDSRGCCSNSRAARVPSTRRPAGVFCPGALPKGEACSISAFSSAPTRTAMLETYNQMSSTITPPTLPYAAL